MSRWQQGDDFAAADEQQVFWTRLASTRWQPAVAPEQQQFPSNVSGIKIPSIMQQISNVRQTFTRWTFPV